MRFKHQTYSFGMALVAAVFIITTAISAFASGEKKAICVNSASDYSSGTHSVLTIDKIDGARQVQNDLQPTISDLGLNAYGNYFYVIERYSGDNITKYDIDSPSTPIWQFSTMDDNDTAATTNPQNLVFVSSTKAYLLRYGSTTAWIVNPSATSQSDFYLGSLDLSAYNDQDGVSPEMTNGVIVGNYLFIVMQRLDRDNSYTPNTAYIAVFDTTTDTEVATGMDATLSGIPLPVQNPVSIAYEPSLDLIFVAGVGDYYSTEYNGGIASINPATFETAMVLDDGDADSHPYGKFSGMAIVSSQKGYFVGYASWGNTSVYEFNPKTGAVTGEVSDSLNNINISGIFSGDANGMLWVADNTNAQLVVVNPSDNSIDEEISTNLNPQKVVFATSSTADPAPEINGITISGTRETNQTITVTADASSTDGQTMYYKFYFCANYGSVVYENATDWTVVQDYSTTNTAEYTFPKAGEYIIVVRCVTDPDNEPTALPIIGQAITIRNAD